jgi:hypothetical protein
MGHVVTPTSLLDISFADRSALTDPIDREALRSAVAAAPRADRAAVPRETASAIVSTLGSGFVIVLVVVVPAAFLPVLVLVAPRIVPVMILIGLVGTAISILLIFTFARWRVRGIRELWRRRGGWAHRARLFGFAQANGMLYEPRPPTLPVVGSLLHYMKPRYFDGFAMEIDGKGTLFGNAVARSRSTQFGSYAPDGWFFLSTRLSAAVPHMMLIPRPRLSQAASPLFNLAGTQRLRLEGDFDRHFALYAPESYARDALYVITPDLMALLIDHLPGAFVETIDDALTIMVPRPAHFLDGAAWDRIADLLGVVLPKAHRQTRRYRDERSPVAGTVAQHGRILRPGIPIASAVGLLVFVLTALFFVFR